MTRKVIYNGWDHFNEEEQVPLWEDANEKLSDHFGNFQHGFLVLADIERWDGHYPGGKFMESWDEIVSGCLTGYDGVRLYDENGHFIIEGIHHDGTDRYEVKALTAKGADMKRRWEKGYYRGTAYSDREFHRVLFDNNLYTKLPRFAEA